MANLEGFTRYPVERFCSQCEQDDATNLPLGVQAVARNVKFYLTGARTRDGIWAKLGNGSVGLKTGFKSPITGLKCFKYSGNGVVPDKTVPVVYDLAGHLLIESPPGSGTLIQVTNAQQATLTPNRANPALPVNSYMQAAQTENRAYMAFTNIANPALGSSVNAVLDLNSGIFDPLSMRPVGETFKPGETYRVGECVTPILATAGGNGRAPGKLFRVSAITTGIAANAEPAWPLTDLSSVVSGGVTFTENTPLFATTLNTIDGILEDTLFLTANGTFPNTGLVISTVAQPGGAFAAGRDVYVAITLVNGNGETLTLAGRAIFNTTLNVQLVLDVTSGLRAWAAGLTGNAAILGWNLYVADVANGAPAPALAAYGKVLTSAIGAGPPAAPFSVTPGTIVGVNSSPGASGTFNNTSNIFPDIGDVTGDIIPTISAGGRINLPGGIVFIQGPGGTILPAPTTGTAIPLNNGAFLVSAVGNVPAGVRYAVVLFVNRNGYISGYGGTFAVRSDITTGNLQIEMFQIPIGPPETAQRIIAFSQAGGTPAGPFCYVPANDTVNGVPITTTIINDNVTTTAIFNFTDVYLQDLLATTANVQPFFDKIKLPPCRNVVFSTTMNRMIYLTYNLPSGAYITPQADFETIYASTGLVEVAETNGENLMGWLHFNGIEYALKEESGHEVNPSADDPSNWQAVEKWTGRGPCGLRAYDKGIHFFVFVHKSGVYAYFGGVPEWISKELGSSDDKTMTTWKRINWAAAATIWVNIDDDIHEIRVGVPLDNALVPSHVLKCNFAESVEIAPAIHSTIYSKGKFISSAAARKWSIDTIAANSCIRAKRNILNAPASLDAGTKVSQLLYASASADGMVDAIVPGIFTDNGFLIDSVLEGVAPAEALKDSVFGGVQAMIGGAGSIGMTVLSDSARATADGGVNVKTKEMILRDAYVKPGVLTSYSGQKDGRGERFRLRISTTGRPAGTWFDIKNYAIYIRPIYDMQASK